MIAALGVSFLISAVAGIALLSLFWPSAIPARPWPLLVALGCGIGAGLSAVLLFLWMLAFGPTPGFPLAEAGLAILAAVAALIRRRPAATRAAVWKGPRGVGLPVLLGVAFLIALVAAATAFCSMVRQHPHGEWDAWMNWDLRARMFFRGAESWQAAFSPTFPWSHPDYPILLPSLVARTWLYARAETLLGPALVAATFTFGTVALLATGLNVLRSTTQGLLAALVLLSTPFFIIHGTSFYADVPLGFFFLATMLCLALDARHGMATARFGILAGVAAGLAMWTKNEGTLFTLAIGAGLILGGVGDERQGPWRRLLAFGTGLLPMLLLLVAFKVAFAPANDLLSTLGVERTLGRLTAPDRYLIVLRQYTNHIMGFGQNSFGSAVWLLLAYLLGVGLNPREIRSTGVRAGIVALLLLLAGHFMVFVSMADELSRLLDSSLDRLLLQLWPSALLLYFVAVRAPEEVLPATVEEASAVGTPSWR